MNEHERQLYRTLRAANREIRVAAWLVIAAAALLVAYLLDRFVLLAWQ